MHYYWSYVLAKCAWNIERKEEDTIFIPSLSPRALWVSYILDWVGVFTSFPLPSFSRVISCIFSSNYLIITKFIYFRILLGEMRKHDDAWPFLTPVNSKQFPTYRKVIRCPIDFQTIARKLKSNLWVLTILFPVGIDVRRWVPIRLGFQQDYLFSYLFIYYQTFNTLTKIYNNSIICRACVTIQRQSIAVVFIFIICSSLKQCISTNLSKIGSFQVQRQGRVCVGCQACVQ